MEVKQALEIINRESGPIAGNAYYINEWHLQALRAAVSIAHTQPTSIESIVDDVLENAESFGVSDYTVEYMIDKTTIVIERNYAESSNLINTYSIDVALSKDGLVIGDEFVSNSENIHAKVCSIVAGLSIEQLEV